MGVVRVWPAIGWVPVVAVLVAAVPAAAQESVSAPDAPAAPSAPSAPSALSAPLTAPLPAPSVAPPVRVSEERPAALVPLYGSLVALQGLDFHSTREAVRSGEGREANPAMRPVVKHDAAFLAAKAGATVGVIWMSEKMWKKNRKAAIVLTGLVNGVMAAVVAHNYRVSR